MLMPYEEQEIKSLTPRHAKSSTCILLSYGRLFRNCCVAVVGFAQLRSSRGPKTTSLADLLPPLGPPPTVAPGRLLQRGCQFFLRGAGVGQQQVPVAGRQLRGIRAFILVGSVWAGGAVIHTHKIRAGVSEIATELGALLRRPSTRAELPAAPGYRSLKGASALNLKAHSVKVKSTNRACATRTLNRTPRWPIPGFFTCTTS